MRKATLPILLTFSLAGSLFADTLSPQARICRELAGSVRPPVEEGPKAQRYLDDADRAFRDCRGAEMPLEIRVNALLKFGMASDSRGRSQAAMDAYRGAIGLLDRANGDHATLLIAVLDEAASVESRASLRGEATSHARRALDERKKKYGDGSVEIADGLVNLAMVQATFGEYEPSQKLLREAVRIAEKACAAACDTLVTVYSAMQAYHQLLGNAAEAEKYARMAEAAIPQSRAIATKE